MSKKIIIKKEEPEYEVQKEYEGKFKSLFQKMTVSMSKNILLKIIPNAVKQ